jgi:hypothetical protein
VTSRILDQKWDGRDSFTVEETGEIFGVGRCTAYARAADGTWLVIRPSPKVLRIPRWWIEKQMAARGAQSRPTNNYHGRGRQGLAGTVAKTAAASSRGLTK